MPVREYVPTGEQPAGRHTTEQSASCPIVNQIRTSVNSRLHVNPGNEYETQRRKGAKVLINTEDAEDTENTEK